MRLLESQRSRACDSFTETLEQLLSRGSSRSLGRLVELLHGDLHGAPKPRSSRALWSYLLEVLLLGWGEEVLKWALSELESLLMIFIGQGIGPN